MSNKPKPTVLRVLEGNPSKRPLPENEPKPAVGAPSAPKFLSEPARKHWRAVVRQLKKARVMTHLDADALALYCETYARWMDATADVQERGMLIEFEKESKAGLVYTAVEVNPHVSIASKAFDQLRLMMIEFGMTPSSRTKVSTVSDGKKKADPWSTI